MSEEEFQQHLNPQSFLTDPINTFEAAAEPLPPGTKAPPRPPGKERTLPPLPETTAASLITRIESALEVIHAALAEIKRIQSQPDT